MCVDMTRVEVGSGRDQSYGPDGEIGVELNRCLMSGIGFCQSLVSRCNRKPQTNTETDGNRNGLQLSRSNNPKRYLQGTPNPNQ